MSDPHYYVHDETTTTEVAVVLHVQGHVNEYDLAIAAEKTRQLLRWDSVSREGRECSLIFKTALPLDRFELAEVVTLTSPMGSDDALRHESSSAPTT